MRLHKRVLITLNSRLDANRGIEKHIKEFSKQYNVDILEKPSLLKFAALRNKYDVIDCHSLNLLPKAYFTSIFTKTKIIATLHNVYLLEGNFKRLILRWFLRKADRIVCVSDKVKAPLEKYIAKNKLSVICEFLDLKKYKKLKLKKIKNSFLYVGHLAEIKGFDSFIKESRNHPNNKYFIAGDGPLKGLIDKNQKNLKYLGFLNERELIKWYNKVEHVCLPTKYEREGFNRCCMEALACGTEVIASKKIPCPKPNENEDPRKFAKKNFSYDNAKKIIEVYNSV